MLTSTSISSALTAGFCPGRVGVVGGGLAQFPPQDREADVGVGRVRADLIARLCDGGRIGVGKTHDLLLQHRERDQTRRLIGQFAGIDLDLGRRAVKAQNRTARQSQRPDDNAKKLPEILPLIWNGSRIFFI